MLFLLCVPEVPGGAGMLVSVLSQGTSFHTQVLLVRLPSVLYLLGHWSWVSIIGL